MFPIKPLDLEFSEKENVLKAKFYNLATGDHEIKITSTKEKDLTSYSLSDESKTVLEQNGLDIKLPKIIINNSTKEFELNILYFDKKWKIGKLTDTTSEFHLNDEELISLTKNSIEFKSGKWYLNSENYLTLFYLYAFLFLKPLYVKSIKNISTDSKSQLTLDDYEQIKTEEIWEMDETKFLEFKKEAYWDISDKAHEKLIDEYKNGKAELMRDQMLKAICGFHNAEGGVLIIGVKDKPRTVIGIENDRKLDALSTNEGYRDWIINQIENEIERKLSLNMRVYFEHINKKEIARIHIPKRSNKESGPCQTTYDGRKVVFLRADGRTNEIQPKDIAEIFYGRFLNK